MSVRLDDHQGDNVFERPYLRVYIRVRHVRVVDGGGKSQLVHVLEPFVAVVVLVFEGGWRQVEGAEVIPESLVSLRMRAFVKV